MCKILCIARSTYYYEASTRDESDVESLVETIFNQNRKVYGCRKIKAILQKQGLTLSRRKIGPIMKKRNLVVSAYRLNKFKAHKSNVNEAPIPNILNRQFNQSTEYAAVVSDLTYVRVNYKWNYICLIVDLFNREIIGYSAGVYKNSELVFDAFATVLVDLSRIQMFHTDRPRQRI